MSQQAAKRRRTQARQNYSHLAPGQRPNYKKRDLATAQARLARLIATERRISGASKKK